MKCIFYDFRRAIMGRWFLVAFFASVASLYMSMTWLQLPMEMQYYANLLSAWLSPLQHATYTMHNFGYDLLPRVHISYLILGGTSVALMIVSAIAMRRFSFNFTGGYSDE